jgi:hypothetical protein
MDIPQKLSQKAGGNFRRATPAECCLLLLFGVLSIFSKSGL